MLAMNARLCHGCGSILEESNNANLLRNIIELQNEISLGMNLMISVPGVLVTLPPGGSRMTVLAVHAVLFALVSSYAMRMAFPRR
jgi:hypothetical protein